MPKKALFPAGLALAFCALIFSVMVPGRLNAQATPTQHQPGDLQIGAGFSYVYPDFGPDKLKGYTIYGDFDFLTHYGVEGEFRQANSGTSSHIYERNYLIGPRYVLHYGKLSPYAKLLIGRGVFNFPYFGNPPQPFANLAYNMLAIGGGADYRIKPHFSVRADYEYQHWFSFEKSALTPSVITIGAAYHFR